MACDHCYVFEHADQSWQGRSMRMTVATMTRTAERIAEHARAHGLPQVTVILHGGEPLLAGPAHLADLIDALRGPLAGTTELDLRVHTNGVQLDRSFLDLFRAHGVKVGISLDGDRRSNDRHRRYRDGRSSYDKVVAAIDLLRTEYPELYSGLLCTIDVANDPADVYDALVALDPPALDFLWPHHTWEQPPPRPAATPYADWLAAVYERWQGQGRPVPVRIFDSIHSSSQGGGSFTESLGLEAVDLLVVETDGGYEQADSLKTAFHGAPETGLAVFTHPIDDVGAHPGILARQGGLAALCDTCRQCPVVAVCGGGMYAHRYRADAGFANPSVYCEDLYALIEHVQRRSTELADQLSAATIGSLATGYGDSAAVAHLRAAQTTGGRALLAAVGAQDGVDDPAWVLLTELTAADPAALDAVLAHPYVRARAVARLTGEPADGLLAAVALVAAAHAGRTVTLTVPVHEGRLFLPTVGRYAVPGRTRTAVRVARGAFEVAGSTRLEPTRSLTAGTMTVTLEDLDPYRDCHQHPAAERLDEQRFALWQQRFAAAWTLLEKQYGEYLPAMGEGLTTIVPLADPAPGTQVASSVRDAFGSVGIALPATAAILCNLLMHEFQHVKLGAVLDFVDLYDRTDRRLYHAPWRRDPRPLEGLLQGTYAHLAVVDFWRRRAGSTDPAVAAEAGGHFAEWYPQTLAAVGTLQESGALTGLGEQFVAELRRTLEKWHVPC